MSRDEAMRLSWYYISEAVERHGNASVRVTRDGDQWMVSDHSQKGGNGHV